MIYHEIESKILKIENEGKTAVLIGINSEINGIVGIADTLKDGTVAAIGELKSMGLKVAMITGDNRRTADAIAEQVGIDVVIAEVLPHEFSPVSFDYVYYVLKLIES